MLEPEGTLEMRLQLHFKDALNKRNSLSMITQLVNDRAGNMLGSISGINDSMSFLLLLFYFILLSKDLHMSSFPPN